MTRLLGIVFTLAAFLFYTGSASAQSANGYSYQATITISHTRVPNTDQLNFPVLVSGTYSSLATTANLGEVTNSSGYDIIFTSDPSGTRKLNFEREFYSPTTGQVAFWVQLPVVSHTTDTVFYLFYGNSSVTTDQSTPIATWDGNFLGVYHLSGASSLNTTDSTVNANSGTNQGAAQTVGQIAGGANLNGSSQFITMGNVMNLAGGNLTLEAWIKPPNMNQYAPILAKRQASGNYQQYQIGIGSVNRGGSAVSGKSIFAFFYNGSGMAYAQSFHTANNIVDGNWHHVVVTRDPVHNVAIYVDGASQALVADVANTIADDATNTGNFNIGYDNGSAYLNAIVDEARVSNTARSADWIAAQYANQSNPALFYSVVWPTSGGTPPPPALSVSPSSLNLTVISGASEPPVQPVAISSSNASALGAWMAQSDQNWITLSTSSSGGGTTGPLSGSGAQTIYVQINGSVLAASTIPYTGVVTISSSTATPPQQTVMVSVTVNQAGTTWSNGYSYAGTITVAHTQVPNTDQVNFPVLVSGTYPALANTANGGQVSNANGYDIIFASDVNGLNVLNFERELYVSATGQVSFWVQVPVVSHTADTVFYVFYGNASVATDQSSPSGTWDSSYLGVYHLSGGASLNVNDSTSKGDNGTNQGATVTTGEIGGAANLNGSGQSITMGKVMDLGAGNLTLEAWVKPSNVNQYAPLLSKRQNSSNYQQYQIGIGSISGSGNGIAGKTVFAFFYDGTKLGNAQSYHTANNVVDGNWHHVVVTRDSTHNVAIYVDGVSQTLVTDIGNTTAANTTNSGAFDIGYDNGATYLTGAVDEVRVSNSSRSADWITTEYRSENSPSTFYSAAFGQTSTGAPPAPALSVSQSSLSFSATFGPSNPPVQSISISSSDSTALGTWTARSNQPWITLSTSPSGGGNSGPLTSSVTTLYVQVISSGQSVGNPAGSITISASGASQSPQTIPVSLTISATTGSPWSNGYSYAGTITVAHTQVPNTDQVNFPVLVSGTYPALANTANGGQVSNANGYDIIFASDVNGLNVLNFERELYVSATGQVSFWVQVPVVSHTADTVFYVFYGNASVATDQSSPSGTWDSSYLGVYHLSGGASLNVNDSTSKGDNGTNQGATVTTGEIGGAANLNGSGQSITMGKVMDLGAGNLTLEAWVKPSNVNQYAPLLSKRQNSSNYQQYQIGIGSISGSGNGIAGKTVFAFFYDGTKLGNAQSYHTANNVVDGNWHHVVVTRDSTHNVAIYVDGVSQTLVTDIGNTTAANTTNSGAFDIGYDNGATYLTGAVDEVRVSNSSRSADWITTEYRSENSPSTFYSAAFGQTSTGAPPDPTLMLSSGNLNFTTVIGSTNPPAQSVSISSSNSTALGTWTAQSNQPWITLSGPGLGMPTAILTGSGPAVISVQVNASGMAVSSTPYGGLVTITASGASQSPQTVAISLTVSAGSGSSGLDFISAARLLRESSWGPMQASINHVMQVGANAYLAEQFTATPSDYPDILKVQPTGLAPLQEQFFLNALNGNDQLRQRVAFTLSQIFVTSAILGTNTPLMVSYQKKLLDGALGNFFDLMYTVSTDPEMGAYLNMVNNISLASSSSSEEPNENYARELMQLFTIGLNKLNPDGTPMLDGSGNAIPTYGQSDVRDLARAFTGWTYGDSTGQPIYRNYNPYDGPMLPVDLYHDTGSKTILGVTIPANQTTVQDLNAALQIIFQHPNVGPFISTQLIQHLVTSNPSPAYVQRVAAVFADDGTGIRGNLQAVVQAILLDPEASLGQPTSGHLQEPALFVTSTLRALPANVSTVDFMIGQTALMGQNLFNAPSVFNYYSPSYRTSAGLLGPEFQIFTTATSQVRTNFVSTLLSGGFGSYVSFDLTPYINAASLSPQALVNLVNTNFMGGLMSSNMQQSILTAIPQASSLTEMAQTAIYLAVTSSQYQVQN